jgi:hypothetical protein
MIHVKYDVNIDDSSQAIKYVESSSQSALEISIINLKRAKSGIKLAHSFHALIAIHIVNENPKSNHTHANQENNQAIIQRLFF